MAGSGKTTLVQQINSYMGIHKKVGYLINLDPAVRSLPYDPHIDIRDTVRSYLSNSSVALEITLYHVDAAAVLRQSSHHITMRKMHPCYSC
jgi:hypothetical protein